jgi:hypothetical protein
MDNPKTPTERFLVLRDPDNKFMTARFRVTHIIGGMDDCAIYKEYIKQPQIEAQAELICGYKFHYKYLFNHMAEIQACPICHIFIHLNEKGRILNPKSKNYPRADKSLIKGI